MKKRILSALLVLTMVSGLASGINFAATAADSVKYIDRTWDGEKVVETEKECSDYVVVDANTTTFENGKWYVVNGEVTVSSRIVVSGTANLILCDDCTLNANSGIQLFEGNALNIYGQSADSGKLNAKASYVGNAGIGGNSDNGNGGDLTVYGGSIYASGKTNAAGIGGGWQTGGGSFTMYGGSVEAKAYNQYAAGIGKGRDGSQGSFTVYGTAHVFAGDAAPGSETTVAGYQSSRNSYVKIIYTGHVHTWLDATCTEPKTCSECGEKVGLPLGHDWVKGDMVSEATCTQPAVYRYECSLCHETKNNEFGEKAAHNFVDNVCTECGINEFVIDKSGCLTKYNGYGGDVVIPERVTSIGDYAFAWCSSLTEVTIPEGVTSIGYHVFEGCSSLTEVTIPEGVTSIEESAFEGCSSLTEVTIPEGVTSIGDYAFFCCSSLTEVTIPESVTAIGYYAFKKCSELRTVTISDNIQSVGEDAFDGASITTVNYPCGDDLDIIKAYFGGADLSDTTYNAIHDYSAQGTLVSAATCTQPAVYTAKCKGCDLVQGTMEVGAPLGHTWVTGDLASEATCLKPAVYNRECSVCHATDTIEIGELGDHNWQDATCTKAKTCSVCGTVDGVPLGHDFEMDSEGGAKCKRCGIEVPPADISGNVDSQGIQVGDIIVAGTVICAYENDYDAYMAVHVDGQFVGVFTPYNLYTAPTCLKCVEKTAVDKNYNFDIYFETACQYKEANCKTASSCIYCGQTRGELGDHKWNDGEITTEPTATSEGVKTYTCTVCGETKTEALPKLVKLFDMSLTPGKVAADTTPDKYQITWDLNVVYNTEINPGDYDFNVFEYGIKYAANEQDLTDYMGGTTPIGTVVTREYASSNTGLSFVYKTTRYHLHKVAENRKRYAIGYVRYECDGTSYETYTVIDCATTYFGGLIGGNGDPKDLDDGLQD